MDAREELAAHLGNHFHIYDSDCGTDGGCFCGAIEDFDESDLDHADHLADAILAAGYRKMPDREAIRQAILNELRDFIPQGLMFSPDDDAADAILALMEGNK